MEKLLADKAESVKQFVFFKTALSILDLMLWGYFGALIFKISPSFEVVAINFLYFYIFIWVGYFFSSLILDKVGYLETYRFSFFIQGLSILLMLIFMPAMKEGLILFSILKGFSRGIYWPAHNTFYLKEMKNGKRSELINFTQSLVIFNGVVIPIVAGAVISFTDSYKIIFILSIIFCFIVCLFPFKNVDKVESKIRISEIKKILKNKRLLPIAVVSFLDDSAAQTMGMLMAVIPFYLIGSEFGVGALVSLVGIGAAITAYFERNNTITNKIRIGYITWGLYFVFSLGFAIVFTIPILIIRSIYIIIVSATGDPIKIDLDLRIREKVLGKDKFESSNELNLILETVYLFARVISIVLFLIILNSSKSDVDLILRISVAVFTFLMFFAFHIFVKISREQW